MHAHEMTVLTQERRRCDTRSPDPCGRPGGACIEEAPEADAVAEAGRLVQRLPELWRAADLSERRRLLLTLLDAVYIDARAAGTIVTIKPKAAFEAVLIGSPALA